MIELSGFYTEEVLAGPGGVREPTHAPSKQHDSTMRLTIKPSTNKPTCRKGADPGSTVHLWRVTGRSTDRDGKSKVEGLYNPASGRRVPPAWGIAPTVYAKARRTAFHEHTSLQSGLQPVRRVRRPF